MRRTVAAAMTAALSFGASAVGTVGSGDPVGAAPAGDDAVVGFLVRGVGNGHGRGLSQWGSYGRAIDGQSWQTILAAYYGGTTPGTASEPALRVRLTGWDGAAAAGVISRGSSARWNGSAAIYSSLYAVEVGENVFDVFGAEAGLGCPGVAAFTVPEVVLATGDTGQSVTRLQQLLAHFGFSPGPIDGIFGSMTLAALEAFQADAALPVDGVWQQQDWTAAAARLEAEDTPPFEQLADDVPGPIRFATSVNQSNATAGSVLGLCEADGSVHHYRGAVELVSTGDGNRVVNEVDVENYLRGVVPKESPASWGDAAGGAGINALRAQSVAARSYALAQDRYSYASTCDTPSCQVYGGAAVRLTATAAGSVSVEHPNTDRAIVDTAGVVRVWPSSGAIVSTEFSASNGPRTAGGAFAAVADPWDDQPGNPNHGWTRVIDADSIMARYGVSSAGRVRTRTSDSMVAQGFEGIWANEVTFGGARSAVSAWDFRNAYGLPAPGFELVPVRRGLTDAGSFAFIGDSVGVSVTDGADAPLRVLTEGVFTTAIYDARVNRRTQGGSVGDGVTAAAQVPIGTDLVLVELGYNDSADRLAGRIDAVMAELRSRDVGMVAWVTLSERRPDYELSNSALRSAAGRWPELVILDWEAASDHAAADRWFSDGVHLTSTGRAEFAAFLRDAVVEILGDGYVPPTPTPTPVEPRPLAADTPLRVPVTGVAGVPSDAAGVALNVTAVRTSGRGFVTVWPCGSDQPGTSSVNFTTERAVEPNAVVVPVDATGEVCVSSSVGTDVLVDVTGWFDGGLRAAAGDLRLVDTRAGGVRLAADVPLRVRVTGVAGVPSDASGVALNVTAVKTSGRGFLTVWPCESPKPGTSSVNFTTERAVEPNAVVVPVDASGEVCVSSSVATDVLVDVTGWFDGGLRAAAGDLRLVDTRAGDGGVRLTADEPLRVKVTGVAGVPAVGSGEDPVGVALNVTAVRTSGWGFLTVWSCESPKPGTSSVNFTTERAVEPNAVLVPVEASGEVCVSSSVATDVIVDVAGWFDGGLRGAIGDLRLVDTRSGVGPIPPR